VTLTRPSTTGLAILFRLSCWNRLRRAALLVCVFLAVAVTALHAQVRVRGYYRSDGTYVRPHVRTMPDGNPYNNYSYPGNYNPNTGRISTGDPATYLRNYYSPSSDYRPTATSRSSTTPSPVAALQLALTLLGFDPGPADGIYGPRTAGAVRQFQASRSLSGDGRAGPITRDSLIAALSRLSDADLPAQDPRLTIPDNAHSNATGSAWACDRGYRLSDGQCLPIVLPHNAQLDKWGHSWECNRGFYRAGQYCLSVQVPANATLDSSGHSYVCDPGFYRSNGQCISESDECKRGTYQSGQRCVLVTIPANARLDSRGHSWECLPGFQAVAGACIRTRYP